MFSCFFFSKFLVIKTLDPEPDSINQDLQQWPQENMDTFA